jgi:hypothetical protein
LREALNLFSRALFAPIPVERKSRKRKPVPAPRIGGSVPSAARTAARPAEPI